MNTETKINNFTKIKKKLKNFEFNDLNNELKYKNIIKIKEEDKINDIKKLPNDFGLIHSKGQLEKQNFSQKKEDDNKCYIF